MRPSPQPSSPCHLTSSYPGYPMKAFWRRGEILKEAAEARVGALVIAVEEQRGRLEEGWKELDEKRTKLTKDYAEEVDVNAWVKLNVSGINMAFRRSTLVSVEGSMLEAVFSGRWEQRPSRDRNGRIFIDENPIIFAHVLGHLEMLERIAQGHMPVYHRPIAPSDHSSYLQSFLKDWRLNHVYNQAGEKEGREPQMLLSEAMKELDVAREAYKDAAEWAYKNEKKMLDRANETFNQEAAFVDTHFPAGDRIAYLHVGGQAIAKHGATLQAIEDSMLGTLFSKNDWTVQEEDVDADGNYWLVNDSIDAATFPKVLDLLRLKKMYNVEKSDLQMPAESRAALQNMLEYLFPGNAQELMKQFIVPYKFDSVILIDEAHMKAVQGFLSGKKFNLLYRAGRDGWAPSHFHRSCDNKGATLVVVQSEVGYIFGGYTRISWKSAGSYLRDDNAFLFMIQNLSGFCPVKISLYADGRRAHSILDRADYGPTFGTGHDLLLQGRSGSSTLGHTFQNPGPGNYPFTGTSTFTLEQMEVFAVKA